jgi:hypothetical protein
MTEQLNYRAMCYRGAVALNNTGVSLLERGCARQGYETLQDAMELIRAMFFTPQTIANEDALVFQGMNDKLLRASKAYVFAEPQVNEILNFSVRVLSLDTGGLSVFDCLQESPTASALHPVRFDLPSSRDEIMTRVSEPDLECSIILYNFGLASFLMSKTKRKDGALARSNSLKILDLASSVITKRARVIQDADDEALLICLGFHVINTTIAVLVADGNDGKTFLACKKYERICTAVATLRQSEWYVDASIKTAGAA